MRQARSAPFAERETFLREARALLRRTSEVQLPAATLAVDDGPLADRLTPDAVDRETDELAGYVALADATLARHVDAAAADATLRTLTQQQQLAQRVNIGAVIGSLLQRLADWLYGLVGRPDPAILLEVQAVVGAGLALAIIVLLVRGTRERIRRETSLGVSVGERRVDPVLHLRAADAAQRAGRPRDAIHALYLYAFATLAAHEVLRYDAALTDHELLRRAAQIPRAASLAELVDLHARVWFGLRDAGGPDVARAKALAAEVTA